MKVTNIWESGQKPLKMFLLVILVFMLEMEVFCSQQNTVVTKKDSTRSDRNISRAPTSTKDFIKTLLQQGVSSESIYGVSSSGIPFVCGTKVNGELTRLTAQQVSSMGLPAGARGWETIPSVIRADGLETFRLEVNTNGPVTRVTIDGITIDFVPPQSPPFDLRDDGLGEDRVAGDFVFTAGPFRYNTSSTQFPDNYNYNPESPAGIDISRIAGTLEIVELDATVTIFLISPEIGLLRPNIPETSTITLAPDILLSPHVINISTDYRATQNLLRYPGSIFVSYLTNRVYEILPDAFDFIMLFSTSKIEKLPYISYTNFTSGVHKKVQLNYTGTGQGAVFDHSGSYGSDGRLLSINCLDAQSRGIQGNNATHEILHQWAAFVDLGLNQDGAHYSYRSSVGSLVGGLQWLDNGDGTFTIDCTNGSSSAHHAPPLDKYLMGLIDGSNVPTLYVYSDDSNNPDVKCSNGEPVLAEEIVSTVTIADIQSAYGVRSPDPVNAQRDFAIAFVAESHERLLNQTEMTFYEILAAHYTKVLPPEDPDPYVTHGWQSITRFFAEGTTWISRVVPGDLSGNGKADFVDFAYFAKWWQEMSCGVCGWADFTGDGNVGPNDLRQFADNWLEGVE